MIFGQITLAIMEKVLRHTPNHKAAGPDGVPGLALKHMLPTYHEALHRLVITGIAHPSGIKSHTILFYKKRGPTRLDK